MISYNETIYGAFENCKVISDISKISRLKFGFNGRAPVLHRCFSFYAERRCSRMTAIVCVDEAWGMAFHGRRQSRDRAVCARILEDAAGRRLWMSRDTLRLFEAPYPEYLMCHQQMIK